MRLPYAILAMLLSPLPAFAQEDAMEAQRCVWACLRNEAGGDAESPAYAQCVADRCDDGGMSVPAGAGVVIEGDRWTAGQTDDGRSFASIETQGEDGTIGLYYFCAAGQGQLILFGLDGSAATIRMVVGENSFDVAFRDGPDFNWIEADLPLDAPLFADLQNEDFVQLVNGVGQTILALTLQGSTAAIRTVLAGC